MPNLPLPSLLKDSEVSDSRLHFLHACKKVFVQREYSNGLNVKFETNLPVTLVGIISEATFQETIERINLIFAEAERVSWPSVLETVIGCITCYCSRLLAPTIYEEKIRELHEYINQQNNDVYMPANLFILSPMERGLRVIEIVMLGTDPISTRQLSSSTSERA